MTFQSWGKDGRLSWGEGAKMLEREKKKIEEQLAEYGAEWGRPQERWEFWAVVVVWTLEAKLFSGRSTFRSVCFHWCFLLTYLENRINITKNTVSFQCSLQFKETELSSTDCTWNYLTAQRMVLHTHIQSDTFQGINNHSSRRAYGTKYGLRLQGFMHLSLIFSPPT